MLGMIAAPVILALLAMPQRALSGEPYTPKRGSVARAEISDAVRRIHPEYSNHVVDFLMVQGDWAIFNAGKPGGDGAIAATVHRVDGKWTVVYNWYHDDVSSGDEFRDSGRLLNLPNSLCRAWDQKHFHHQ